MYLTYIFKTFYFSQMLGSGELNLDDYEYLLLWLSRSFYYSYRFNISEHNNIFYRISSLDTGKVLQPQSWYGRYLFFKPYSFKNNNWSLNNADLLLFHFITYLVTYLTIANIWRIHFLWVHAFQQQLNNLFSCSCLVSATRPTKLLASHERISSTFFILILVYIP